MDVRQDLKLQFQTAGQFVSWRRLGLICLSLLAFSLPFELESPLLAVGLFRLTNVELLLMLSLMIAGLLVVKERRWQREGWLRIPVSWLILLALFSLGLLASAFLAPEFRLNAFKATFRTLSGLVLALAIPQLIEDKGHIRFLIGALLAGGLLSVMVGLVEVLSGQTFAWLNAFRSQPTVAGPFVRLSGSFNHANQTAMFIEATVPFLVAVTWQAWRNGSRLFALLGVGIVCLYLQAGFLTYSRSSFVTIFLSTFIIAVLLWWSPEQRRQSYTWAAVAVVVLLLAGTNSLFSPVLRLRLSSEGDNEWYNFRFRVPEHLELTAGTIQPVTISVKNEGALVWSSEAEKPFNLGGRRWYRVADNTRSNDEMRWSLDRDVAPGETITQTVPLVVPSEEGEYEFEWDVVQEQVIWFSMKNGLHPTSQVTVVPNLDGTELDMDQEFSSARPRAQPIPNRSVLWRIAALQFLERPLLGIGLDNFRLTYGQVMGWQAWNESIHTNNWYIETVVSAGILGGGPFLIWLGLLGWDLLQRFRMKKVSMMQAAVACGLLAYLIHGLLDYFLLFNGTGLLFWLFVGLWMVFVWLEPSA